MDLLEKYEIYKKGLVPRGTTIQLQKFFKTKPTIDQLLLMQQMNREDKILYIGGLFIYLLLGVMLGMLLQIWITMVATI
jgi:hypothetical protein